MTIMGRLPGLLVWLANNSSDHRMQGLQRNKDEAHTVARKLLDLKRQEFRAGASRKDLMSLLGLLSPPFAPIHMVVEA